MAFTPWLNNEVVDFAKAVVGDEAYTWQWETDNFGDYLFETAGDPREFYEETDEQAVIRKRWRLMEVTTLPAREKEEEDDDD